MASLTLISLSTAKTRSLSADLSSAHRAPAAAAPAAAGAAAAAAAAAAAGPPPASRCSGAGSALICCGVANQEGTITPCTRGTRVGNGNPQGHAFAGAARLRAPAGPAPSFSQLTPRCCCPAPGPLHQTAPSPLAAAAPPTSTPRQAHLPASLPAHPHAEPGHPRPPPHTASLAEAFFSAPGMGACRGRPA